MVINIYQEQSWRRLQSYCTISAIKLMMKLFNIILFKFIQCLLYWKLCKKLRNWHFILSQSLRMHIYTGYAIIMTSYIIRTHSSWPSWSSVLQISSQKRMSPPSEDLVRQSEDGVDSDSPQLCRSSSSHWWTIQVGIYSRFSDIHINLFQKSLRKTVSSSRQKVNNW